MLFHRRLLGFSKFLRKDICSKRGHNVIPSMLSIERCIKRSHRGISTGKRLTDTELVIFDKDGTIICFHTMWAPWSRELAVKVQKATGLDIDDKIFKTIGFCPVSDKMLPGLFAEGTALHSKIELVKLLNSHGVPEQESRKIIDDIWTEGEHKKYLKPVGNPKLVFETLIDNGIKVAVCTSDNREGTEAVLTELDLDRYISRLMCGNDHDSVPKPAPDNALRICKELNVDPLKTVMVGDTKADVQMSQSAKLGLMIGVLSGVGKKEDLHGSDHLIDDIDGIFPLIMDIPENKNRYAHQVKENNFCDSNVIRKQKFSTYAPKYPIGYLNSFSGFASKKYSTYSDSNTYDYVIVGAGSAGCVLANRLSENKDNKVLLLEAGPKDNSWKIHMPAALMYNLYDDTYNWYYSTEPEPGTNNRVMYWPRGRVWGGSSSLNAMVYIRGNALDYDNWETLGAESWSYSDCLPYFRKAQCHQLGGNDYRGGKGPLHVSRGISKNPLFQAFIDAGTQAGYPLTEDMNGYQQEGVGWMDMTIHYGRRWSSASAYLRPALRRENLTTEVEAFTKRILFEKQRAIGIEYEQNGESRKVYVNKEVILSAGAINSPQLLMLSGVGNENELRKLEIPVIQHLPGVGQNLQDHLDVRVQYELRQPISLYKYQWKYPHNMITAGLQWFLTYSGDAATAHFESGGFIRSKPGVTHPDIQFHFVPTGVDDHGRKMLDRHACQIHVGTMRPTSRGYVSLKTKNYKDHPKIVANYLSTQEDIEDMRASVRLSREIFQQKAFEPFVGDEINPGKNVQSDAEIDEYVRRTADTNYHPSCTCKMGQSSDEMAVVDTQTKVFGLDGLRVVDASIMPAMISGNLNGPTIMIAEKASDIIMGHKPLLKSEVPVYRPKTVETQR
ncbi:choline dehydrogenase, mitochondrial-like [Mytilus californianus]|uniref:choline dehydrogenase, mitochondrial-like n=1 Tax=Mytilus californianus TaxID=6549 RepID=UPI0022475019|nr:choline dehydrogenase, mitochondrial-like [Mytilus californianus]